MVDLTDFYGPNAGYVLDLYERYQRDPQSVDEHTRALFDGWSPSDLQSLAAGPAAETNGTAESAFPAEERTSPAASLAAEPRTSSQWPPSLAGAPPATPDVSRVVGA